MGLFSICSCNAVGDVANRDVANQATGKDDVFITSIYNKTTDYSLTVSGGKEWNGQKLSPPLHTVITPNGGNYLYCLFSWMTFDIHDASGAHVGTASVSVKWDGTNHYLYDSNGFIKEFVYNAAESSYPSSDPWQQRIGLDVLSIVPPVPAALTNAGWASGMGNAASKATASDSFWLSDYGADPGRWTVQPSGGIAMTTALINGGHASRAHPGYISQSSPSWKVNSPPDTPLAPGTAFDGVWQIDMKIGSNGGGNYCETFYLAERFDMTPSSSNYRDGNGGNGEGYSREIDIMETKWKPAGPQANCPTGDNTGWTSSFNSKQMGSWSDVGGAPNPNFVTFGCMIRGDDLWIYAYKPDGSQWYCTDAIKKDNATYQQKGPFVPYIGTWLKGDGSELFKTVYNNFVYLPQDNAAVVGKNPLTNPDAFGRAIV